MEELKLKKSSGNLKKLKEEYEVIRKKYGLPDFKFMNENFEIENIEVDETELFIKMIRKHVTEKVFFVLRSLEIFINPQNAPLFMFDIIKSFGESDKNLVKALYKRIAKYELEAFNLEAVYNEQKEGEFVKSLTQDWKEISEDLMIIYGSMKQGHEHESKKTHKSYFG